MATLRKQYSKDVIEYAKKLFLTVDKKGNRIYSYNGIAKEVYKKFNKKVNKSTIYHWSKDLGWHTLLDKAIVASAYDSESAEEMKEVVTKIIEKDSKNTITKILDNYSVDDDIIEKLAKAKRWIIVNHLKMAKKLYKLVQEKSGKEKSFARLCDVADRVGKSVYDMLDIVKDTDLNNNKNPIIIINEITGEISPKE